MTWWGWYLGIKTIEKHPELYHAYIGIGQVSNQLESERLAYDYIVAEARKVGDSKTGEAFEAYDKSAPDFPSNEYPLVELTEQRGLIPVKNIEIISE